MRSFAASLAIVLALALFAFHAAVRSASLPDVERGKEGRSWEDMSLAISYHLRGEFPVAAYEVRTDFFPRDDPAFVSFRADLRQQTADAGIRPWQFWRTIPAGQVLDREPRYLAAISDDAGRARLLGWSFRLLRGISPYLVSWVAVLVCLPVLAWVGFEFHHAGRPLAGAAFLTLVALSPYVVEMLELPYSAAGFYLVGALALVAFAVPAALGRSASKGSLVVRLVASGIVVGTCAACRRGTLFLVPAFVLCLSWALARVTAGRPAKEKALAWMGAVGVLLAPYLLITLLTDRLAERTARAYGSASVTLRHRPWLSLWEGLGDFDRTRGYEWRDAAARRFAAEEGGGRLLSPRSERLFREKVLRDVRQDPLWYASILGKRALATVSQWKLRPWGPMSGQSVAPAAAPNEGLVDAYYRLTATVDWMGIADRRFEVPLPVLWLAVVVLLVLRLVKRRSDSGAARGSDLRALAAVALGVGAMPVLVSTASALETQAFGLVYFLGFALLAEERVPAR